MTDQEKSQTVQRIEAVEIELFECPFCNQLYEEEQMMEIGVDRREVAGGPTTRYHHKGTLCTACAETIFDYQRPSSSYNWTHVPRETFRVSREAIVGTMIVMLLTFVVGYVLGVGLV